MVSIGLKGLPLRTPKSCHLTEDCLMAGDDNSHNQGGRKRSMGRKATKKRAGFGGNYSSENLSGGVPDETFKAQKFSRHQKDSEPQTSFVRFCLLTCTISPFIFNVVVNTFILR